MRTRARTMALVLVAVLSGCGPGSGRGPEHTAAVKDVVQTIDPAKATTLELGKSLEVVAELPQTFDGDPVSFRSFAESGVLVGVVTPAIPTSEEEHDSVTGAPLLAQAHPVMYDVDADAFTVLDDRDRPAPTQVGDVAGNETAVVWVEVVGTMIDHSEFTIYSYDRSTKKVAVIGEFDDPEGQIVYGNDLDIAGDTAYFSTPAYPEKRGEEAVHAVPVDGSAPPRVIAKGGAEVTISGDTLGYQVADPDDRYEYPASFTYDLRSGEVTPVPVSAHVDDPGFCGAEVTKDWDTWCVGREYRDTDAQPALLTIKETSGRTSTFEPFPIDPDNVPIPHDLVALGRWTGITVPTEDGQDREFLADLDTKQIAVFPENTSFGALSPDRTTVLLTSSTRKAPVQQRIVRIPA